MGQSRLNLHVTIDFGKNIAPEDSIAVQDAISEIIFKAYYQHKDCSKDKLKPIAVVVKDGADCTSIHPVIMCNGIASWQETHFEISSMISEKLSNWDGSDKEILKSKTLTGYAENGRAFTYKFAWTLTNEFERLNEGRKWDGEFFDEVEAFFESKDKI